MPSCSSDESHASLALAKDDVVKLHIGAHIDGFAAISAETIIVGATEQDPATGRHADAVKAAWHAAEAALRTVKVGNKNWAVTDAVAKVAAAWDCKPVEGACDRSRDVASWGRRVLNRNAIVSTDAKRHRWKEAYHPEPD